MSNPPPITDSGHFRLGLKFSPIVSALMFVAIAGSGLSIGTLAFRYLREEKTADSWSILYVELERLSSAWSQRIATFPASPTFRYEVTSNGQVTPLATDDLELTHVKELGIGTDDLGAYLDMPAGLWLHNGQTLRGEFSLGEANRYRLQLQPITTDLLFEEINYVINDFSQFYIVNRNGQLIYSVNPEVSQDSYVERRLVQAFIQQTLTTTFFEFDTESGEKAFGYYRQIPGSNLTLFIEVPTASILGQIARLQTVFYLMLTVLLAVVLTLVQVPLGRINGMLRQLLAAANQISDENYNISIGSTRVIELHRLGHAFEQMALRLRQKDRRIHDLILAEKEKVRLEGQVEIAATVQELFLANRDALHQIQKATASDIASTYLTAQDASGDWYQVALFPERCETVYAIADVSGHGVGAAMFTAIIDGMFERYRDAPQFEALEFMQTTGQVMYRIGKKRWACTMQVVVEREGSNTLTVYNAGHVPAQLFRYSEHRASPKGKPLGWRSIQLGSDPLGLCETPTVASRELTTEPGDILLLYTDGITETQDRTGRQYGLKRLRQAATALHRRPSQRIVDGLIRDCAKFRGQEPHGDDICIISIKFSGPAAG